MDTGVYTGSAGQLVLLVEDVSNTKVGQFDNVSRKEQNVLGLDVAVDDVAVVQELHSKHQLPKKEAASLLAERHWMAAHAHERTCADASMRRNPHQPIANPPETNLAQEARKSCTRCRDWGRSLPRQASQCGRD
jgi:hypothetical protein